MESIEAEDLVEMIEGEDGNTYKANHAGAWEANESQGSASVVEVDRGHGYEEAIVVDLEDEDGDDVLAYYVGPFEIEQEPEADKPLLFRCKAVWLVRIGDDR
jgi:hypothetical protein